MADEEQKQKLQEEKQEELDMAEYSVHRWVKKSSSFMKTQKQKQKQSDPSSSSSSSSEDEDEGVVYEESPAGFSRLELFYNNCKVFPVKEWIPIVAKGAKQLAEVELVDGSQKKKKKLEGGTVVNFKGNVFQTNDMETLRKTFFPHLLSFVRRDGPFLDLQFENISLNAAGFISLYKALITDNDAGSSSSSSLRVLNLRENALRCDSMPLLAEIVTKSPYLERLHVGSTFLWPEGVEALCGTPDSAFGLASRCSAKRITHLTINYNTLGDAGVETVCRSVADYYALEFLDLGETSMSDKGAAAVVKHVLRPDACGPLRTLVLACNKIGPKGALEIAGAFTGSSFVDDSSSSSSSSVQQLAPPCTLVEIVDLGNNPIGDEGAMALATASAVAPRLQVIDFTSCDLPPQAGAALIRAMEARPASFKEAAVSNNERLTREQRNKLWALKEERKPIVLPPRPTNAARFEEKSRKGGFSDFLSSPTGVALAVGIAAMVACGGVVLKRKYFSN